LLNEGVASIPSALIVLLQDYRGLVQPDRAATLLKLNPFLDEYFPSDTRADIQELTNFVSTLSDLEYFAFALVDEHLSFVEIFDESGYLSPLAIDVFPSLAKRQKELESELVVRRKRHISG
jgi:hypothetical protein